MGYREHATFLLRREGERDARGRPSASWEPVEVCGVTVRWLKPDEAPQDRPDGVEAKACVALPKGAPVTAANLAHARLALTDRGMDPTDPDAALRVTHVLGPSAASPTAWDTLVYVGRFDG